MEHFEVELPSAAAPMRAARAAQTWQGDPICGVAASGNLEVLVEPLARPEAGSACVIEIHTAAEGFREIWEAVLRHFASHHAAGGLRFSLNDVGATPAVVSLRLVQAYEAWCADVAAEAPR